MTRHKFNAKSITINNIRFSSRKEGAEYGKLLALKNNGEILFFLRQVPVDLPGGIIYRVDFLIFWANGEVEFREVKGYKTPIGELKIKQVEDIYNIKIKVV